MPRRSDPTRWNSVLTTDHFDMHHTVTADEIDAQQHVHNLRYLQWTLWAARDHSAAGGWDAAAALADGLGWVVRGHDITYRAAALAGDQIVVRTWIADANRYSCQRGYLVCRPADQTILAKVQTRWVFIDLRRHKALSIPAAALAAISVCPKPPSPPWTSELSS